MAINTQTLYDRVRAKVGGSGNTTTFATRFLDALRYAIYDMNNDCLLSGTPPEDIQTNVDLDAKHEACLEAGVCYYLGDFGYKDEDWTKKYFAMFKDKKRTAQMQNQIDEEMEGKFGDLSE